MVPVMIAALFWRRSTKWGALAATLWVAVTMFGSWYLYGATQEIAPKPGQPLVQIFPALGDLFQRSPTNVLVHGYLPVLPMCLGSALWMIVVSLLTPPPKRATIERYSQHNTESLRFDWNLRPRVQTAMCATINPLIASASSMLQASLCSLFWAFRLPS